jgi:hypothetical protein
MPRQVSDVDRSNRSWLPGFVVGLGLAVVGFFCLHYTNGMGIEHHTQWAAQHGFPKPSYTIFLAGIVLMALGCGIAGRAIGRRSRRLGTGG